MKKRRKTDRRFFPLLLCLLTLLAGFTAQAAQDPVTARLPVRQEFHKENAAGQVEDTFTYTLTAKDQAPLPEEARDGVYTFTLTGSQTFEIPDLTYTHGEIYHYTLCQQVEEEQAGYTYDTRSYAIDVYVKNEAGGQLSVQVIAMTPDGRKADEIVFENSYKGTAPGTGAPGTQQPSSSAGQQKGPVKTGDDVQISGLILAVLLSAAVIFALIRRKLTAAAGAE